MEEKQELERKCAGTNCKNLVPEGKEFCEECEKKKRRCLGHNCSVILTNGEWFCPKCKKKLKEGRKSIAGIEERIPRWRDLNGGRVIKKKISDGE